MFGQWGVKQTVVATGVSRWYTNDRHTQNDAEDLALHHNLHSCVDPLTGNIVLYTAEHLPDGENY
jgi:hypothetical protein